MRRLPDGKETTDETLYLEQWHALADAVLAFFPGYNCDGFDPHISLVRWEKHLNGKSTATDRINMSVTAAICLTTKKEPPRRLREDL
jgi:hypothetical protein